MKWKSAAARRLLEMSGVDSVDKAVPAVVAQILSGISCPPTDIEALCARLNVAEIVDDDIPVVGTLCRENGTFRIVCAAGQSAARRRFTIAHELAHVLFESSGPRAPRVGTELERLCDMLAAEVLMPRALFQSALGGAIVDSVAVRALASQFQTSLTATAIRCVDFCPISVVDVDRGQVRWRRGPAQPTPHQLEQLMSELTSGDVRDGLVVIPRAGVAKFYRGEWIRTTGDRSGLLLLTERPRELVTRLQQLSLP